VLLAAAACAPAPPSSGASSSGLLIENVRVFDPRSGTFSPPTDLLVRGDRIARIGDAGAPATGIERLDAGGRYALPGLWDAHVHFSFLTMGGDSLVRATLEGFVRNGVTSVRDVGGPLDTIGGLSRRVTSGEMLGPRIHYTGPVISRSPIDRDFQQLNAGPLPGTAHVVETPAEIDAILDRLVRGGATMTKAIDRWDATLLRYFVGAAKARSLRVVWDPGLPILNPVPIDSALAIGVSSIEHGRAAWPGVLRDDLRLEVETFLTPGVDYATGESLLLRLMAMGEESVVPERLAALAGRWARTDIYFCPTLRLAERNLENPSENYRAPFEGLLAVSRLFARELSARGVKLLVGQDFIDPAGTVSEMQAMARAGVPIIEILRGATLHPAEWLGVDDRFGTLEPGKTADILIVDGDPLERLEHLGSVWRVVYDGVLQPPP
jgi:hypothetical protein